MASCQWLCSLHLCLVSILCVVLDLNVPPRIRKLPGNKRDLCPQLSMPLARMQQLTRFTHHICYMASKSRTLAKSLTHTKNHLQERRRDAKTQWRKDNGTQRHRSDTKTQEGHKDTEGTQRHRRDTKTQEEHKETGGRDYPQTFQED